MRAALPGSVRPEGAAGIRAAVVGACTLDRYGAVRVPGGGATYGALCLAGLGARVHLFSAVGPDFPVLPVRAGLELRLRAASATASFVNRYDAHGRRTQLLEAAPARLEPGSWSRPTEAELLFLAPVFGELEPGAWRARVPHRVLGLAIQGLVRKVEGEGGERRIVPRVYPADPQELDGVDAAFLSEEDLAGQGDLIARLRRAVPVVVLTRGARGASIFQGGRALEVGIFPTREVDPTGAGDVFAAAFLLAWTLGAGPAEAGRLGAAAASVAIEAEGPAALERISEAWQRQAEVGGPGV